MDNTIDVEQIKEVLKQFGTGTDDEKTGEEFWQNFRVADDKIEGYLRMLGMECGEEDILKFKQEQDSKSK